MGLTSTLWTQAECPEDANGKEEQTMKEQKHLFTVELNKSEMREILKAIAYKDIREGETNVSNRTFNKIHEAYSKAMGWKE